MPYLKYRRWNRKATLTRPIITGTSTRGPMTAAKAAPEWIPKTDTATAIALYGPGSGAALATVVGVLVEVPVMLSVCSFCNRTRHWFPAEIRSL